MRTLFEVHEACHKSGQPCAYWGERHEWFVAAGRHRDSDSLEESNFRSLLKKLGGESDTVAVERENHWLVGWVENLLIDPADVERVAIAEKVREDLEDYPVVDESDWSDLEYEQFWTFAEGELREFTNWENVLHEVMNECNSGPGDESAEWQMIEDARERLEELQPLWDSHASSPVPLLFM
jgi:hypothetical protein